MNHMSLVKHLVCVVCYTADGRMRQVQYNNLANHGPTKGPPVLRYHDTCSKEGQNVDVVRGLGRSHCGHSQL